jgi:hypothetical protein
MLLLASRGRWLCCWRAARRSSGSIILEETQHAAGLSELVLGKGTGFSRAVRSFRIDQALAAGLCFLDPS